MPGMGADPKRDLVIELSINHKYNHNLIWWVQLTEAGYDVWLAFFRGTSYSQKHTTFDNTSYDYWNFAIAEYGIYDIPAFIDLVYTVNGGYKVYPITASMTTTAMHIALATELEENFFVDRVEKAILLAPCTGVV